MSGEPYKTVSLLDTGKISERIKKPSETSAIKAENRPDGSSEAGDTLENQVDLLKKLNPGISSRNEGPGKKQAGSQSEKSVFAGLKEQLSPTLSMISNLFKKISGLFKAK
jgi:hypothetical protein